uniref:Uncharacterized protein n=1 Tax=Acrobeloides nanus TaxID=290746 RepID=A0A914BV89_9BILA
MPGYPRKPIHDWDYYFYILVVIFFGVLTVIFIFYYIFKCIDSYIKKGFEECEDCENSRPHTHVRQIRYSHQNDSPTSDNNYNNIYNPPYQPVVIEGLPEMAPTKGAQTLIWIGSISGVILSNTDELKNTNNSKENHEHGTIIEISESDTESENYQDALSEFVPMPDYQAPENSSTSSESEEGMHENPKQIAINMDNLDTNADVVSDAKMNSDMNDPCHAESFPLNKFEDKINLLCPAEELEHCSLKQEPLDEEGEDDDLNEEDLKLPESATLAMAETISELSFSESDLTAYECKLNPSLVQMTWADLSGNKAKNMTEIAQTESENVKSLLAGKKVKKEDQPNKDSANFEFNAISESERNSPMTESDEEVQLYENNSTEEEHETVPLIDQTNSQITTNKNALDSSARNWYNENCESLQCFIC